MDIRVERVDCTEFATPLLAVKIFQGESELVGPVKKVDEALSGQISRIISQGDFRAAEGDTLVLYPAGDFAAERILLVGLGKREKFTLERMRQAAATATRQASRIGVDRFASVMHHAELVSDRISAGDAGRAVVEGAILADYRFDDLKAAPSEDSPPRPRLEQLTLLEKEDTKAAEMEEGIRVGGALARGENLARQLGNLPGNIATPSYLANTAEEIASDYGMKVTILGPKEMAEEGMHALLAVAQGSEQEPRFIVLEHRKGPADQKPLVLVGKGLTFDAGGISIKPAANMEEMKFDMCGGAAVLGAMRAIGELQVPVNVVALVPSSENLLSGRAMKPGDIIQSHLGKSIEVVNTDAEGRLILADALSYARRFEPVALLDAATLTGAHVIALGHHATAALGNDEALIEEVRAAGDRVGQRIWPLPMFDEYREQLNSDYADIKNSGGRPAGTITAAWFLRDFVGEFPWVHLDIAGTASGDGKLPYHRKGATGVPTRTFVDWVISRAG